MGVSGMSDREGLPITFTVCMSSCAHCELLGILTLEQKCLFASESRSTLTERFLPAECCWANS